MRCAEARQELPAYVRDGSTSLSMRRHLLSCPDCRSELARYEDLIGSLAALRGELEEPPANLVAQLVAIPETAGLGHAVKNRAGGVVDHVLRNRGAYAGGAAVALGVAGAALLRSRSRRVAAA